MKFINLILRNFLQTFEVELTLSYSYCAISTLLCGETSKKCIGHGSCPEKQCNDKRKKRKVPVIFCCITIHSKTQQLKSATILLLTILWVRNLSKSHRRQLASCSIPCWLGWLDWGWRIQDGTHIFGALMLKAVLHVTFICTWLSWSARISWQSRLNIFPRVKMETSRPLKTQSQKSHSVTSVACRWSQQISGPAQTKGRGKRLHLLIIRVIKSYHYGAGGMGEIVAIFENNMPSTCEANENKKQRNGYKRFTCIQTIMAQKNFYFLNFIYLFIFGCVGSSLWCAGFSLWWLLLLRSTGSRRAGFSNFST